VAKEKETIPKFSATIAYSKHPVAGVPLYSDKKDESTLEEMLEKTEKDEVLSARKDAIITKLKKQSEPNPKRFTVDPETGRIEIDEEEGQFTQKEAMMISASIRGKSGEYDAAIALITAAKELVAGNQPAMAERPKEFLVDPETGEITRDPENGEYTLSEARTISYSIQKGTQPAQPTQEQKGFLDKLDEMTQGLVSQRFAAMLGGNGQTTPPKDPVDEFFTRLDQVDKLKQRFAPAAEGSSMHALAQSGVRGELMKLLLEDERDRLKMQYDHETQVERNKHLGGLASVVKENLGDGIRALTLAAQEAKGGTGAPLKPETPQQAYECPQCHTQFAVPQGAKVDQVGCPACGAVHNTSDLEGQAR